MSKKLANTKTLENLLKSFAGEAQARNRYTMFSKVARVDGFENIANIFLETAENEFVHAKRFYDLILKYSEVASVQNINIQATYPVSMGDTLHNLKSAAMGEHEEFAILYPEGAEVADAEGFSDIAHTFRAIATVESTHEQRYLDLATNVAENEVFKKIQITTWQCLKCGYHHIGHEAPNSCPACLHPKAFFTVSIKNY